MGNWRIGRNFRVCKSPSAGRMSAVTGIGRDSLKTRRSLEASGQTYDYYSIDAAGQALGVDFARLRSEEHTSELQSLMRISYAVVCLTNTKIQITVTNHMTN